MKKQNQFKLIWLIPVVIIAATVVTVVIFGLSSKGVSGTPGYKVELDFNFPPTVECIEGEKWNYCVDSLNPELSWKYEDEEGNPQEYYWIQIDNNADFSSPTIDTDWVPTPPPFPACTYRPTDEILDFNTPSGLGHYYWQVKVKDSAGRESNYCLEDRSFTTPKHAYPNVTGEYEFTWSPSEPHALEPIQFNDKTKFYNGATGWEWIFPPGTVVSDLFAQNPVATFSVAGEWDVELKATDDIGTCSTGPVKVNVSKPLPEWEEVEPKPK